MGLGLYDMGSIFNFIAMSLIIVGVFCLQIFLSNKDNPLLGLVPPAISFIHAFYGIYMVKDTHPIISQGGGISAFVIALIFSNIYTYVLLGIHLGVRGLRDGSIKDSYRSTS